MTDQPFDSIAARITAAVAATQPSPSALLPETITVTGRRYTLVTDVDELRRVAWEERTTLLGHTDRRAQLIYLDADAHPQVLVETLMHELLHVLTDVTGLADEWDADTEETIVNRLAPALTRTLVDNPQLLEVLTDAEHLDSSEDIYR